ncbi:dermonecrotic toxin domain-containing protein [Pseudomonas gingeri]|uniref:dermonecrotic toxin domain-containing protein n=1 Tax=Pseudomonas gingeri TaxID=117681 RepID=UPI0015A33981|nr:DUF6543 domain-containing protein [Pseudomonas gingeri]NWA00491.1 hypothetical protein [Pseudomonas gingeri]NWA14795.1 hypothetical protein [Pseudomonas gingeri]NWA58123.1 hypothetical protein [Pseudomonas gingeri]NWA96779.1 hypothetical protein [Pseudomonas gingeri]NWB03901.1 hypothetical protein [Pseudomonas gingeri]
MTATAPLPVVDLPGDYLMSSDTWSDHDALDTIAKQLTTFLAPLAPEEQRRYLALCREEPRLKKQLAESLQGLKTRFERSARHDLRTALYQETGRYIDPEKSRLNTKTLKIPPRTDAKDPIELIYRIIEQQQKTRPRRALDPSAPVEEVISISLWQAARENFSFTGATASFPSGFDFQRHSTISAVCEDPTQSVSLNVERFISIVRSLDLGARLRHELHEQMTGRINDQLGAYQKASLELAALEALRRQMLSGADRPSVEQLMQAVADRQLMSAEFYSLDFGRDYLPNFGDLQSLPLPFCLMRFERGAPQGVFSFFPDRPGGALRYHLTSALALKDLREQIRRDAGTGRITWLTRTLSLMNQADFYGKLKAPSVDESALTTPARWLYKAFGDTEPPARRINLVRTPQPEREQRSSVLETLTRTQSLRLIADIANTATSRRSLDWQTLINTLQWMASETLELLLLPLPGGALGLNHLMISASLGTLAYQSLVAGTELASGKKMEFVQAISDVAELVITARIQAIGARLSARRTRTLIESLGRPRKVTQAAGDSLWLSDLRPYTPLARSTIDGLAIDARGLFKKDGRFYVQIRLGSETRVGEVMLDHGTGRYHLMHADADRYRPAMVFDPGTRFWKLAPVDIGTLSDTQLLQKMLRRDLPSLNEQELGRLMKWSGLSRSKLEKIWQGDETAPWEANQAVGELQVRKGLDQLQTTLDTVDAELPPYADKILPALLARQMQAPLQIESGAPGTLSRYAARQRPDAAPKPTIMLVEIQPGRYRPAYEPKSGETGALLETTLKAYEHLNQRNWISETPATRPEQTFGQRLTHLRKALATDIRNHQHALYLALLDNQTRSQLKPSHPAHAFAPVSQTGRPLKPAVGVLRERFPGLSQAAAIDLVDKYSSLHAIALDSRLEPSVLAAVQASRQQSRIISALASWADKAERGLGEDSEALFCRLLCTLPRWPGHLQIRIDSGIDSSGRPILSAMPSRSYGLEDATTTLRLFRNGERYMGIDATGGLIYVPSAEHNLAGSLLRSLNDARRDALGYRLDEPQRLVDDLLRLAEDHREDLKDLLPIADQYLLTPGRLAHFRQEKHLPISDDEQSLYNFAGKRYVNIDGGAYQVMDDREASSPGRKVYRIVKPGDPVATDPENRYVATRPGRSEPIIRRADGQWVGIVVGGAGGMPRKMGRLETLKQRDNELVSELETHHRALQASQARLSSHLDAINRATDGNARRAARIAHEVYLRTHLNLLEQHIRRYETHRQLWIRKQADDLYRNELQSMRLNQVEYYSRLFLVEDDNFISQAGPSLPDPLIEPRRFRDFNRKMLASLTKRTPILEQRQAAIASLLELAPGRQTEQRIEQLSQGTPATPRSIDMGKLVALSNLLAVGDPVDLNAPPIYHFEATQEMTRFREVFVTLDQIGLVPEDRQIAVLDNLLEQTSAIRESFEAMNYYPEASTETAHQKAITNIVGGFDNAIVAELEQRYARASSNEALSTSLDAIDLDFLPAQPSTSHSPAPRKRLIKVRRGGEDHLKLGQERITDNGETLVDIIEEDKPDVPFQSYHQVNGQWRGTQDSTPPLPAEQPRKLPATRLNEANQLLGQVQTYLANAHRDEQARQNPSNIVEYLDARAGRLEQHAADIAALPATEAPQAQTLAASLRQAGLGLRNEGENIRLRLYKDPNVLSVQRLLYLIDKDQIDVSKIKHRGERGKGTRKSYLDVYSIRDKASGDELWHAHFHYARKDAAPRNFELRGGHLKTLEQSGLGVESQIRQQQQGLPHTPIWREAFDGRTAQQLFDRVA